MFVKKDDGVQFFYKGRVRPGDSVPEEVARVHPELFEEVVTFPGETTRTAVVDEGWKEESTLFPIEEYDDLTAREILDILETEDFDEGELRMIRDYEAPRKDRKTVLREINRLLEG